MGGMDKHVGTKIRHNIRGHTLMNPNNKPHRNQKQFDTIRNIDDIKYLMLESGDRIKLDLIYSVDNEISPFYSEGYFNCDCV